MDLQQIDKTASLSENNSLSLMVFKMIGNKSPGFINMPFFGINIFKVKEVLNFQDYKMSGMPKLDSEKEDLLKGVINVRGEYIPVYNLNKWLGYPDFDENRSVIIISEVNNLSIGIHVGYIHGVFDKSWTELKPSTVNEKKVSSETIIDDELCLVIDVENMIGDIKGQDLIKESEHDEKLNFSKTILFADDSKSIRDYVSALMNNLGVKSLIYSDGQGIIDYLENNQDLSEVGLILTDLEMPNVSGHTVIKTAKGNSKSFSIPVVVHSSMTVSDSKRQAKELGADDFVGKIDTQSIIDIIRKYS